MTLLLLLLFPTFGHCLYRCDPLLSFFRLSGLEEVVGLIRGDDLEEVAVHVILFGWNPERGEGKGEGGESEGTSR